MSPSRDPRIPADDNPYNNPSLLGRMQETTWGCESPTEDSLPNNPPGRRREMLNCDDPPSYSSLTIRRSNDPDHPWNRPSSTYRPLVRASSTAGPSLVSHRQPIRQPREHELRNAVQSSPESRLGSSMASPPFLPSLPSLSPLPSQAPLSPGSSWLTKQPPRSLRSARPASTKKPPGAVSTPDQPPLFPMSHAPAGMTVNHDGTSDQARFPGLTQPWPWGYTSSNSTNTSAKTIAPINQETGEVHGSHFAKLTYANVDFSTPSSASKDTSRTTLPIQSLGDRNQPPVFGEPTPLKSRVLKPTVYEPPAYQPNVYTSPKSASDAGIKAPEKTISRASGYESTQVDSSPGLRARLATIRDLRQRKYTDAEIDTMVADMGNVGLSFPELLEMLRNGPQTDTSTKKVKRAQSKGGARPTTSTTPTTPAKRDVPTYSLNPSDVEGRRTQLPVRSQTTTKPIKSRFAVENLASVQTDPAARAELDRVLAIDKSKAPEEKVPEEEFETLNLDSDEEEWDKIDADDEWEVVDDPRAEVEKNVV